MDLPLEFKTTRINSSNLLKMKLCITSTKLRRQCHLRRVNRGKLQNSKRAVEIEATESRLSTTKETETQEMHLITRATQVWRKSSKIIVTEAAMETNSTRDLAMEVTTLR